MLGTHCGHDVKSLVIGAYFEHIVVKRASDDLMSNKNHMSTNANMYMYYSPNKLLKFFWKIAKATLMLLLLHRLAVIIFRKKMVKLLPFLVKYAGFLFEAGGWTLHLVIFHSMSGTLISIFEGFLYYFINITCFCLSFSWIHWLEDNRKLQLNSSKLPHHFFVFLFVFLLGGIFDWFPISYQWNWKVKADKD